MKESALGSPGLLGHKGEALDEQSHDSEKQVRPFVPSLACSGLCPIEGVKDFVQ